MCDRDVLRLFNSDTAEEDFSGFSAQEEDDINYFSVLFDQPFYCRVTGTVSKQIRYSK